MLSDIQKAKLRGKLIGVGLEDLPAFEEKAPQALKEDLKGDCPCIHPDEPDDEIADKEPDELVRLFGVGDEIDGYCWQQMHRALLAARETGSGSLPPNCHPDVVPDRHVSLVYIERDTFDNSWYNQIAEDSDLQVLVDSGLWGPREYVFDHNSGKKLFDVQLWFSMECFRLNGCYMEETTDHEEANVHMAGKRLPGYSGVAWFGSTSCSSHVNLYIDNGERRGISSGAWLDGHEFGHTHKEPHRFNRQNDHQSLLSYRPYTSPFIGISLGRDRGNPQWPVEGKTYPLPRDPIADTLHQKYGNVWVPRPGSDEPQPPQPPDDGKYIIEGTLTLKKGDTELGKFNVKPQITF